MVALEKRRRGIEDQYLENFRKFRRFVVLTFVLFGIGWLVLKPVRQHEFDYSIFYNVNRDPVGDPIGQPTLDPSNEHLRIGSKAMVSSDVPLCSTMGKEILQRRQCSRCWSHSSSLHRKYQPAFVRYWWRWLYCE